MASEANIYTTLATSSSMFLGLLTALIVNQIVGDRAEKSRIHERFQSLTSELSNLKKQREDLEEYLIEEGEELGEDLHKRDVNDEIDVFFRGSLARDYEIPVSEFNWVRLQEEYEAYTGSELSYWEIFELADRVGEAREIVEERNLRQADSFRKRVNVGFTIVKRRVRQTKLMDILFGPDEADNQASDPSGAVHEVMRETARESTLSERDAEWARINSNIDRLNSEINDRLQDYQSISTGGRLKTLGIIALSAFLSVISPLMGLFLNVTGYTVSVSRSLNHLDLIIISLFWVSGLILVFVHIFRIIRKEQGEEEPSIDKPDVTVNKHPLSKERSKQRLFEREGLNGDSETVRYINESVNPDAADSINSKD